LLIGSNAPLRVVVAAQETLGAAAIALMSLVVGANLYNSYKVSKYVLFYMDES
jgi:hypothetical protein